MRVRVKRVLLIKATVVKPEVEGAFPPMGILYVAAALRRTGDYEIRVVDTSFRGFRVAELEQRLREFRPDVVGISAITPEATSLHSIATEVKHHLPDTVVVAGGPHPTYYTDQVLRDAAIDFVVIAEGEESFGELLQALRGEFPVEEVRGIAYRQGNAIVRTPPRPALSNLDAIPFPAWDLVEAQRYATLPTMSVRISHEPYMVLVTSRGCPFKCTYCHDMHTKTFRARSPENVLEEMEWLIRKYGVREFEIIDDIFNFDLRRAERIFDLIIERKLDIRLRFPNGIRGDVMNRTFLKKFRQAGGHYTAVAIESASPRLQKLMKKHLNLERVQQTIRESTDLGIFTLGFFMLGFPTETKEEIAATVDFAVRSNLHAALFNIVTPYEGTEIADAFKAFLPDPDTLDTYHFRWCPVTLCDLSPRELRQTVQKAYTRFYLSRKRLLRQMPGRYRVAVLMNYLNQMYHITFLEKKEKKAFFVAHRRQLERKAVAGTA